jgi:hypothetical protein
VRFELALIVFQGMVNEIVLGILDPLPLDDTSKVETFHPHGVMPYAVVVTCYSDQCSTVIGDSGV